MRGSPVLPLLFTDVDGKRRRLRALWFGITKNPDVSIGPLACSFAHSFICSALLVSLVIHNVLICSLASSFTHSQTSGKVDD